MLRRPIVPVLAALIALSPVLTAADTPTAYYVKTAQSVVLKVPDLKTVATAKFFLSSDDGKSWSVAQETPVADTATEAPAYVFKPATDGRYAVVTCAVWRNGTKEAEPVAGALPKNALVLIWDATPPQATVTTAKIGKITDKSASIDVTWTSTDANPVDSVTLEASTDGGTGFAVVGKGAGNGSSTITVPIERSTREVLVRVTVSDRASNSASSTATAVALPPPADPEVELQKAVKTLPSLADVTPAVAAMKPDAPAANGVVASPLLNAASSNSAVPYCAGTINTGPHADVIAPNGVNGAGIGPIGDAPLVDGSDIETDYFRTLAAAKGGTKNGPDWKPSTRSPATAPAPVTSAAGAERPVAVPDDTAFLTGDEAQMMLDNARSLARTGDRDAALDVYLRLHRSDQARAALPEELVLLRTTGQHVTIVGVVDHLPPELLGDVAHLEKGRALLALNHPDLALRDLSAVRKGSPQARPALLEIARAFAATGKPGEAERLFAFLAKGDDAVADLAKAEQTKAEQTKAEPAKAAAGSK